MKPLVQTALCPRCRSREHVKSDGQVRLHRNLALGKLCPGGRPIILTILEATPEIKLARRLSSARVASNALHERRRKKRLTA